MNANLPDFHSGAVAPIQCLKEGWAAISDRYWLFLGMTLIWMLIAQAVPIVLMGPMTCGLYLCLLRKMRNQPIDFGMLFKGFDFFLPSLIAAVLQMVPVFIVMMPMTAFFVIFTVAVTSHGARNEPPPLIFFLGLIVFVLAMMLLVLLITTLFVFAYPLVVDRNLSGVDAVKTSIKAGWQNLGGILGLLLLNLGLSILGLICCYVGVFFVMPISFASYAAAYRQVFPQGQQGFTSMQWQS